MTTDGPGLTPVVCDGCHATLAQLETTGHHGDCSSKGRHMHHIETPLRECAFWIEEAETHDD